MNPISYLVDRLLTYLELKRADRFAREQAHISVERQRIRDAENKAKTELVDKIPVVKCGIMGCTIREYHAPCHHQTALAARRDRERKR